MAKSCRRFDGIASGQNQGTGAQRRVTYTGNCACCM